MITRDLSIKSGLPFKLEIVVKLPTGRDWWLAIEDFELLSQIREQKQRSSALVLDLSGFITTTMDDANTVNVLLEMTGNDTRSLERAGFYDVIISDPGVVDARAYVLVSGAVKHSEVITAKEIGHR